MSIKEICSPLEKIAKMSLEHNNYHLYISLSHGLFYLDPASSHDYCQKIQKKVQINLH